MGMIGNSLAQGLISGANIQDGTVDTPDIKDSAVTTAKINDGAITTAKITDANVTAAKLASGAAVSNIGYTPVNKAGDALGGGAYTKVSTSTTGGNLSFDNGTGDTPGLHFYYGNSKNFGLDVNTSKFRVVKNLDESGGAEVFSLDEAGNSVTAGSITSSGGLIASGVPATVGSDLGFNLYSGNDANSYSRLRFYEGPSATGNGVIHCFSSAWGSNFEGSSKGAININGTNGVTFGVWNNPDVTINSTRMKMNGDRYTLYGPNSTWGAYLRVGGNGNPDQTVCSVATTNGNLHLDPQTGKEMYLNWYAGAVLNVGAGNGSNYGTIKYGTLTQISDHRLKSDVVPMPGNALATLMQVEFKEYTLDGFTERKCGVIADALQTVIPTLVSGEKDAVRDNGDPNFQSVDYVQLSIYTAKALQELKAEFDAYKEAHP